MTSQVLPEIISKISRSAIKSKLMTENDAIIAGDLFIQLIERKSIDIETVDNGKITDLFVRMIDVIVHCDRSPTYEGQEIEAMVLNPKDPTSH